ncbi:MAG: hypothetical protein ACRD1Z_08020, partial [Vicinamibacteria bacterium]
PVKDFVLKFLASYAGIVAGVAFLVSGLKWSFKKIVEGREPLWAIGLTFVVGIVAKAVMPGVYGENSFSSWMLHLVVLLFVAIGAQTFHDKMLNPLMGKLGGNGPPPPESGEKGGPP